MNDVRADTTYANNERRTPMVSTEGSAQLAVALRVCFVRFFCSRTFAIAACHDRAERHRSASNIIRQTRILRYETCNDQNISSS